MCVCKEENITDFEILCLTNFHFRHGAHKHTTNQPCQRLSSVFEFRWWMRCFWPTLNVKADLYGSTSNELVAVAFLEHLKNYKRTRIHRWWLSQSHTHTQTQRKDKTLNFFKRTMDSLFVMRTKYYYYYYCHCYWNRHCHCQSSLVALAKMHFLFCFIFCHFWAFQQFFFIV